MLSYCYTHVHPGNPVPLSEFLVIGLLAARLNSHGEVSRQDPHPSIRPIIPPRKKLEHLPELYCAWYSFFFFSLPRFWLFFLFRFGYSWRLLTFGYRWSFDPVGCGQWSKRVLYELHNNSLRRLNCSREWLELSLFNWFLSALGCRDARRNKPCDVWDSNILSITPYLLIWPSVWLSIDLAVSAWLSIIFRTYWN